jgi:transglutaminase-like putative cysteine protease
MPTVRSLAAYSDRPIRSDGGVDVDRLSEAVVVVANRRMIGGECLPRSLVMWTLLRRRGVDAELVIGADVRPDQDLDAHAWVEVNGVPLVESRDVRSLYGSLGLELPRLREER